MASRAKFSLLTTLLLTALLGAVIAVYVVEQRRRADMNAAAAQQRELQSELETLRIEQGHLIIEDEEKAYVVEVLTEDRWIGGDLLRWRYRVYLPKLPEGVSYLLRVCRGTIPTSGYPYWDDWRQDWPGPELSFGVGGGSLRDGEHLIDFALVKGDDGRWRLRNKVGTAGWGSSGIGDADWTQEPNNVANLAPAKLASQQEFDSLEPIPLMRIVEKTQGLNDNFKGLRRGFIVYIEPHSSSPQYREGPAAAAYARELMEADK